MTPDPTQEAKKLVEETGERISANSALLRLFKNEYRESSDRHSDSLFVRDYVGALEVSLAALTAERDAVKKVLLEISQHAEKGHAVQMNAHTNYSHHFQVMGELARAALHPQPAAKEKTT